MKKLRATLAIVLLGIIAVNIYLYYLHNQMTHIVCQGNSMIRDENYTLNLQVSLNLSGDFGQATADGELIDKEGKRHPVGRSSSFRFKQVGNSFYINNYSVAELASNTVDQATLKEILPPYVLFKDISTILDIYPISRQGYLISSDKYMHFICKK